MADKSQTDDKQPDKGPGAAQNPYPVDPTNELLDGDNIPSSEELDEADVKVSESGRALLHKDAPENAEGAVYIPPPQSANLERKKTLEKHMAAAAESVGEFSVEGEAARAKRVAEQRQAELDAAAEQRQAAAAQAGEDKDAAAQADAKKAAPQGRSSRPTQKS
jgi:hypothetical protein